jgi:hypothetical protein
VLLKRSQPLFILALADSAVEVDLIEHGRRQCRWHNIAGIIACLARRTIRC